MFYQSCVTILKKYKFEYFLDRLCVRDKNGGAEKLFSKFDQMSGIFEGEEYLLG